MTANTIQERKEYINEIKASFQEPNYSKQYGDFSAVSEIPQKGTSMFKLKILIAIVFFTIFVYCDQMQVKIHGYSADNVYEKIEETISIEKAIQIIENMI